MKKLNREEAVVLGLLSQIGRKVGRTKLVKMVYLLDNTRFEHLGDTMTGITYHWDHYGPNDMSNTITGLLSDLGSRQLVCMTQSLTPYENYVNNYSTTNFVKPQELPLSTEDWVFIDANVNKYGRQRRETVVAESKRTAPVQQAQQYDVLEWVKNDRIERLKQSFFDDGKFVEETVQALNGPVGDWITLDELRAEVA